MSVLDGELGAGAEPSRQLQDHCQGEHQGEPDTSRARSGTCARAGSRIRARRPTMSLSGELGGCGTREQQSFRGPSKKSGLHCQGALGPHPSSATSPTCGWPLLCPGPAGLGSGSLVPIRTLQWGP